MSVPRRSRSWANSSTRRANSLRVFLLSSFGDFQVLRIPDQIRFRPLALRDVLVQGEETPHFTLNHQGDSEDFHVHEGAVFRRRRLVACAPAPLRHRCVRLFASAANSVGTMKSSSLAPMISWRE